MDLDVEILSRLQFAFTIMFHYLFPPLTIGLGWIMVYLEGRYLWSGDRAYEQATRFWTKIFAVNFAMGVATGIVMEFQFGTNWAVYSRYVGDVFGSALAAEGIFAFFLESGFLAVLVFGWDRVGPKMHFFSTLMVAVGATFSAVWIVVANSWQQTPAGYHIVGEGQAARAEITDFWAMVFNPSSVDRLTHVLIGCIILGGFFVMSISAFYLLRRRHDAVAMRSFKAGLVYATAGSLAALVSGHFQAQTVAETQPAKLAAFEGHFETGEGGAPLYLFGMPDAESHTVRYGIAVPGGLSFLVHERFSEPVTGLDAFPEEDWPPVNLSFQSYHLMVAIGMVNIALTLLACWLWWRGRLFDTRWMLWILVFAVVGPYVANQAGWVAAEVGRQPWIVQDILKTSEAYSPSVPASSILGSIIMFGLIYLLLFVLFIYLLDAKIKHGPDLPVAHELTTEHGFLDSAAKRTGHEREPLADPNDPNLRNKDQQRGGDR